MITRFLSLLLLTAASLVLCPAPAPAQPATVTGPQLAAQLRALQPTQNAHYSGILQVKPPRKNPENKKLVNYQCSTDITVQADSWTTVYRAKTPSLVHSLTIVHQLSKPNQYFYTEAPHSAPEPEKSQPLSRDQVDKAFAGSDFSLADLGQEHFHWPQQSILKTEMRISRNCRVLESKPAKTSPHPYSRVLSWIDIETGAIVLAEAYDKAGKLLKEFYVKKIEKVNGHYQPEQLQMRNFRTSSRTRLTFKFE